MSDVFDHKEFSKIRTKAESFYNSVVKVNCPALHSDVHFSSDGFHHLRFDNTRAERTKVVQRIKLICLEEAVEIIRKTTTVQEYREMLQPIGKADKNGLRPTKTIHYYAFHAVTDLAKLRRINVVVRKIGNGNFHFWSVMPSWKEEVVNGTQRVRRIGGRGMADV